MAPRTGRIDRPAGTASARRAEGPSTGSGAIS
ncbi:hypothetical protein ABID94_002845 [Streptomyces sp. PvR018]